MLWHNRARKPGDRPAAAWWPGMFLAGIGGDFPWAADPGWPGYAVGLGFCSCSKLPIRAGGVLSLMERLVGAAGAGPVRALILCLARWRFCGRRGGSWV